MIAHPFSLVPRMARYNPELWPVFMAISAENGTDNRRLN